MRIAGIVTLLALLCLVSPLRAETVGRIVAVVNAEAITLQEIEEGMAQSTPEPGMSEEAFRQAVLKRLIEKRLILQKAEQMEVTAPSPLRSPGAGDVRFY